MRDSSQESEQYNGILLKRFPHKEGVLISIVSGSVLSLIFCREAWTSVIQRTQKSFVEIPLGYDFIKIINYLNADPKFKLREIK